MERETEIDRLVRQMIEEYGRGASIIADQRAASYTATADFERSRIWLETAAAIRKLRTSPHEGRV